MYELQNGPSKLGYQEAFTPRRRKIGVFVHVAGRQVVVDQGPIGRPDDVG
jgi:hypothetical protein